MPHITVIIKRVPHATPSGDEPADTTTAEVAYEVPHEATEAEVGQAVKRLFKQVRALGE
jgi:hypothetical protein